MSISLGLYGDFRYLFNYNAKSILMTTEKSGRDGLLSQIEDIDKDSVLIIPSVKQKQYVTESRECRRNAQIYHLVRYQREYQHGNDKYRHKNHVDRKYCFLCVCLHFHILLKLNVIALPCRLGSALFDDPILRYGPLKAEGHKTGKRPKTLYGTHHVPFLMP